MEERVCVCMCAYVCVCEGERGKNSACKNNES